MVLQIFWDFFRKFCISTKLAWNSSKYATPNYNICEISYLANASSLDNVFINISEKELQKNLPAIRSKCNTAVKLIPLLPSRYPLILQSLPGSHTGYSVVNLVAMSLPSRYPLVTLFTHWFPVLVTTPSFSSFGQTWSNFYSFNDDFFYFT